MKRLVSSLLVFVMMLSAVPLALAAEENVGLIVNETFNNAITNSMPSSITLSGEGSLAQAIKDGNRKILRVRNRWENAIIQLAFAPGGNDKLVLETKVKVDDNNSEKALLQYANNSNRFTLVTRKRSGELYDMNNKRIGKMPKGEWMIFSAAINMLTLRYELFVNGKLVSHRGVLKDPGSIEKLCFESMNNTDSETTMYCDYMRVYTGQSVVSENYFPAVSLNENEKATKQEHASEPKYKPSVIFEMDCEAQAEGQGISGVSVWSGKALITAEPDKSNKFYRLTYEKGVGPQMGPGVRTDAYPSLVIQGDFRVNRDSKMGWTVVARGAAAIKSTGQSMNVINILPSGKFTALDQKTVISEKSAKDGWVNVAAVIDYRTKDVDYYVDQELVLENFPFTEQQMIEFPSTLYDVRFVTLNGTSATGTHYMDMDNVYFYKGIKSYSKDELMGGGAAMDMEEELDYTLDSTPLNPKMSAFTKVDDSISTQKNPSKYLTDYSSAKTVYKDAICIVAGNSNVWVKNGKYSSEYKFVWDGTHILGPAPTLAAFMNKTLSYDEETQTAKIDKITAKAGDKFITVDGKEYASQSRVEVIDGILYIPVREFVRYGMNKFYGESTKGFGVIAPDARSYSYPLNAGGNALIYTVDDYSHMMAYLILDRLNADSLKQWFDEKIKGTPYPRVSTIKEEAPKYKEAIETDPQMKEFSDLALDRAKTYLTQTLNIPDVPGVQINGIPGITVPEQLYYAYYMTGDRAYVDKALEFADFLVKKKYWNHDAHFLSTSWICLYLANVYDVFYDELTQEEKDTIANTCIEKAIKTHQMQLAGAEWNNWPIMDYNWNVICNAGPMLASMIFLGEGYDDTLLLDTIEKAQISLGYFMHYFAPDGGGWETMGYTNYILSYYIPLLDGIVSYFGDDLGFLDYPGSLDVGTFLVNTTGHKNSIPIHDDTNFAPTSTTQVMWFTKKKGDYEGQRRNIEQAKKNGTYYALGGFEMLKNYLPNPPETEYTDQLDYIYRGIELGTARDKWGEGGQAFMAAHAGANNCAHYQFDLGNFFFEANGEIWANDLGREDYALHGPPHPYAMRAEGHNLWVVNPDSGDGQNKVAYSKVLMKESKPKGAIFTVDLLPAYYNMVEKADRGYMLSEDRKVFTVQDEIVPFEGNNDFYWNWHTQAEIEVDNETKTAELTLNNKKCIVYFDSNVDFLIEKQDTLTPLPASPKVQGQLNLPIHKAMNKIMVNFYSDGEPVIFRAVAVPYGQKWERSELTAIDEWTIPDGSMTEDYADADMIYLNGVPVPDFKPNVYDYTMYYPSYYGEPEVTVDSAEGNVVEIIPRSDTNKTIVVRIADKENPENIRSYTITAIDMYLAGKPENALEVKIVSAQASASDGNVAQGAIDDDPQTRWSSANDESITVDLGEVKEFNALGLDLFGNDGRMLVHEIWISDDNENFTKISEDRIRTLGTNTWEYKELGKQKARFVKLTCHGSSIVVYNSIEELKVYNVPESK